MELPKSILHTLFIKCKLIVKIKFTSSKIPKNMRTHTYIVKVKSLPICELTVLYIVPYKYGILELLKIIIIIRALN